jgi:hypothetical protein
MELLFECEGFNLSIHFLNQRVFVSVASCLHQLVPFSLDSFHLGCSRSGRQCLQLTLSIWAISRSRVALIHACDCRAWQLNSITVYVFVLLGCKGVQALLALGLLLLLFLLLLLLALRKFALEHRQLVLQRVQVLSLLVMHLLLLHLLLDLFQLLGLLGQCHLLFVVNLLLESNHVLLEFIELDFVLIPFACYSAHF